MGILKGRIISKNQAQAEINKYLDVREETFNRLQASLEATSTASQVYFNDKEISFIFDLGIIDELLSSVRDRGCNALRVYYAAAPEADASLQIAEGSTTVVLVPAQVTVNADGVITSVRNVIVDDENAAVQYPGGGPKGLSYRISDLTDDSLSGDEVSNFRLR